MVIFSIYIIIWWKDVDLYVYYIRIKIVCIGLCVFRDVSVNLKFFGFLDVLWKKGILVDFFDELDVSINLLDYFVDFEVG